MKYCESIYTTKRRPTREVMVGKVGVGGDNPIRIQSMTTSSTRDVEATIVQIIKLADAGCEIARVTVQGIKEAEACEHIKDGLLKRGYDIPLVADIHFFPPAAMLVADFVDKVRINPGNFVDKRATFKILEYDDETYQKEIEKIEEKFTPLVEKCKRLKRSLRIGTNHGSLSDRIMNRYGDTPQGMVESAIEFANICRKNDYHDFMFSMKSSNPKVMIQAYRLLAAKMYQLNWDYPLHLGVTEAGEGEDGRIKSAMGIGALMLDGLGDTIRVSLTEDPWLEIDPCIRLINFAKENVGKGLAPFQENHRDFEKISRRTIIIPKHLPLKKEGTVILSADTYLDEDALKPDFIVSKKSMATSGIAKLEPVELRDAADAPDAVIVRDEDNWESLKTIKPAMIILRPEESRLHFCRKFFEWLQENKLTIPVILNFQYECSKEDLVIRAAAEYGALFCDGLGDGIWLEGPYETSFIKNLSFNILQSARMRIIKTEFISCPSCGRTLFNLQEVTKKIQSKTKHLPGVKIAIMGCIVNGPGEMADADFGFVGSKAGKIDLYVGKNCIERNIDFAEADDRLVELIKAQGRWVDP